MNLYEKRILVDTSAWIVSFRSGCEPEAREFLSQKVTADQAATSPLIILELIQGCKTVKERDRLRLQLESLQILELENAVWERAYSLGFDLRRKGLTIPAIDILIISLALEHDCLLLHFDRHFVLAAQHLKNLEIMAMAPIKETSI
jgi:predicted nucleic acid-binding protein